MGSTTYRFLCVCLSPGSAVGQGLRPFVVYPPSCLGGRFYTTKQFMGGIRLTGAVLSFLGSCFNTVSNILLVMAT